MPFGPSVVFTRSAIAMAPTKDACSGSGHVHSDELHRHECAIGVMQRHMQLVPHTMRAVSPRSSEAPAPRTPDCWTCGKACKTCLSAAFSILNDATDVVIDTDNAYNMFRCNNNAPTWLLERANQQPGGNWIIKCGSSPSLRCAISHA